MDAACETKYAPNASQSKEGLEIYENDTFKGLRGVIFGLRFIFVARPNLRERTVHLHFQCNGKW